MATRKCSCCGTRTSEVYVFNSGDNYACSDACRDKISHDVYGMKWDELSTNYDEYNDEFITDENFYYTEL
jgi:hypothetical protein